jgi:hypothetical protein
VATLQENATQLIELELELDSVKVALNMCKNDDNIRSQVSKSDLKRLSQAQTKLQYDKDLLVRRILENMTLSSNVQPIQGREPWCIVRYIDSKADTFVGIYPIPEKELYLLKRDGRVEKELSSNTLSILMPGIEDIGAKEARSAEILGKSHRMLGLPEVIKEVEPVEEESPSVMSYHSGLRWVQRVKGIPDEFKAKDYLRENYETIQNEVTNSFDKAEDFYVSEYGIKFRFSEDNIMYVQGDDGKVVTQYYEEFGFTPEINRMIVLKQREVILEHKERLEEIKGKKQEEEIKVSSEVKSIDEMIKSYEAKIRALNERKSELSHRLKRYESETDEARYSLRSEENKLFREWKVE